MEGDVYQVDQEKEQFLYSRPRVRVDSITIIADELLYDRKSGILEFTNNVTVRQGGVLLTATTARYDTNTLVVSLNQASLYDNKSGVYIRAAKVEKFIDNKFIVEDGVMTLCKPESPAWEIRAGKITFFPDNFAYAYNASIFLGAVPIFYTPFFSWPTKEGRASGFLAPLISSHWGSSNPSKNYGYRVQIPYFLNLGKDHDATITTDLISQRGVGIGLEYRYAFVPGMFGQWNGWYLDEFRKNRESWKENMGSFPEESMDPTPTRYMYNFNHRQSIFWGGQFRFHQRMNSDNEINREYFDSGVDKDVHFSQSADFTFPWKDGGLSIKTSIEEDFTQNSIYDINTDKDTHLNSLPSLSISQSYSGVFNTPLSFKLSGTGTNYQRTYGWNGSLFQGVATVSSPFQVDFLNIKPAYTRTWYHYDVHYQRSPTESSSETFQENPDNFGWFIDTKKLEFNFELFRLFKNRQHENVGKLSFRPRLIFEEVDDVDQRKALSITPGNHTLNDKAIDYDNFSGMFTGAIKSRKTVTFRWESNYLVKNPKTKKIRKFLHLNLSQTLNWNRNQERDRFQGPQSTDGLQETVLGDPKLPLRVDLGIAPTPNFSAGLFYRFDHKEQKVVETKVNMSASSSSGSKFILDYKDNSKQYHEPDGTNHNATRTYTVTNQFKVLENLDLSLIGTWDLNRNNLKDLYSENDSKVLLDRQLTDLKGVLTYTHNCYKFILSYEEKIKTGREGDTDREYLDRVITFSFNLSGMPAGVSPYQQTYELER